MEEVLTALMKHRARCTAHAADLSKAYGVFEGDLELEAFYMCFNNATFVSETCSYFAIALQRPPRYGVNIEREKTERQGRIILLNKMLFIFAMSALEYSAKRLNAEYPTVLQVKPDSKGNIYLSGITGKAAALNMITHADRALWEALYDLRNCLVHNNGISNKDLSITYPDGTVLEIKKDKMTKSFDLRFFVSLTDWAVESYATLCGAFLKSAGYPLPSKAVWTLETP